MITAKSAVQRGVSNPNYPDSGDVQGYTGYLTEQYAAILAVSTTMPEEVKMPARTAGLRLDLRKASAAARACTTSLNCMSRSSK